MSRKDDLREFHMNSIAKAALNLFEKQGVDHTTMDQLAQEAQYSKATLYVYYKSKELIYYYIVLKGMQKLLERMKNGISIGKDIHGKYKAICFELAEYSEKNPFQYDGLTEMVAVDQSSRNCMPILDEIYETGEQINDLIAEVFHEGIEQGVFRSDIHVLPATFILWSSLSSVIRLAKNKDAYIRQRMNQTRAEFLEQAFAMLFRTIAEEGVAYEEENH